VGKVLKKGSMALKVLMIGWELPPFNSGGLGVACLGLTKALAKKGVNITFVLPQKHNFNIDFLDLIFANIEEIQNLHSVYATTGGVRALEPGNDFINQAYFFGERIKLLAPKFDVDLVHSHDWLTFPAGVEASKALGKPLIVHIHSTEYDRTGGHYPNPIVCKIEKEGLEKADKIISVSQFTKNILVDKYAIAPRKIDVVHNAVDITGKRDLPPALSALKNLGYKVVLYLGRITLQKGPEYFIRAAKKVSEFNPRAND